MDHEEMTPQQLSYLAGRGSTIRDRERENDIWGERILRAGNRSRDVFSEMTGEAWENGDRAIFDDRGDVEFEFAGDPSEF